MTINFGKGQYYFRDLIEGFLLTKFHRGDFFLHAHCAWFGDAFDSFGEDQHHHIHHVGCMQCSHSLKNACYFCMLFQTMYAAPRNDCVHKV